MQLHLEDKLSACLLVRHAFMLPSDAHNSSESAQKTSILIRVFTLDSASPVLDPSDLILTRGTLDEEDEEADSDTDDIDHRGERQPVDTAAALSAQEVVTVERRS